MERLAFLSAWEWQCCGDPFKVGDRVQWILYPADHADPELAITDFQTHHWQEEDGEPPPTTGGRVEAITAVFQTYAPRPGENPMHHRPVAGTIRFQPRDVADAWNDEFGPHGDPEFQGYVVRLATDES